VPIVEDGFRWPTIPLADAIRNEIIVRPLLGMTVLAVLKNVRSKDLFPRIELRCMLLLSARNAIFQSIIRAE